MGHDRVYAIGDIHGQLEKLRATHALIDQDRKLHPGDSIVVHIGDLVDRGPDSAGVLSYLIKGLAGGAPWVVLKGNHDRMMAYSLQDPPKADPGLRPDYTWLTPRVGGQTTLAAYGVSQAGSDDEAAARIIGWLHPKGGGQETLASYGVKEPAEDEAAFHALARKAVPREHVAFLEGLDTEFRSGDALFVHAGVRPGIPLGQQTEDDLLWIREPFLSDTRDHGALIVHGHTPIETVTHYGNRVNIDTGAGYGGPLSAIVVEGRDIWQLTDKGRIPLTPPDT